MSVDYAELTRSTARYIRAKRSLVDFRRLYLAVDEDVEPADYHRDWDRALLRGKNHVACEAYRESGKTEYAIRANLLHALTFPTPNRSYVMVICATKTIAEDRLIGVSREFLASPELSADVEEVVDDSRNALEIRYADGQRVRLSSHGKGSAIRGANWNGRRPDLILCDDLQDFEDLQSESVPEKDWKWFLDDVMFLGKSSRIFAIGNNLGEKCIMEQIIRNRDSANFDVSVIPVVDEHGFPKWPSRYSAEGIEAEKEAYSRMGQLDTWYRNRMCLNIAPESQKFRREMFRYTDAPPKNLSVYTVVDPAVSRKPGADYSAVVTVGVGAEGHWFVLDVDYGRYDPSGTIDAVFAAVRKWRPLTVGVETVAYQAALKHFLEKEMPLRNCFFRITPLRAEKKKELRIDTLQPRIVAGSVWFPSRAPWLEELESELLAFPYGVHDDVIDALAYMEQIARAPVSGTGNWDRIPTAGRL